MRLFKLLKPSRFNLSSREKDGYYLILNTFSGSIIRLNEAAFIEIGKLFDMPLIEQYSGPKEHISLLVENGFLIEEDVDELKVLNSIHENSCNGRNALGIAILPTLACNFACSYCTQQHLIKNMSEKIEQSIIEYLIKNIQDKKILYVTWFGGEPTLRISQIQRMSKEIIKICQNRNVNYYADIVTNGYLLNRKNSQILKECNVHDVQVTLDGPAELHDKRRYLINGGGTFNVIFDNIIDSCDLFDNFIVRVNIDRYNASYIPQLLEILRPIRDNIQLAFRCTFPSNVFAKIDDNCLTDSEYSLIEKDLIDLAYKNGFKVASGLAVPGTIHCSAYLRNAIMVDPFGDLHLCPHFLDKREKRYGILREDGTIKINPDSIQTQMLNYNPLQDPECINCNSLPLCMGGCTLYRKAAENIKLGCYLKNNLIEKLIADCQLIDLTEKMREKALCS